MTLTADELASFVRDGFVVVRNAVDRRTVDGCRSQLWDLIPEAQDDPSSWAGPVRRIDSPTTSPFGEAAHSVRLLEAYDQLVGPGRWRQRHELGNMAVRFPSGKESGNTGWHFDGSFSVPGEQWPRVTVSSRDRGLLMLFLLSDVGVDDAPTRIKVGSHQDVPRYLAPFGATGANIFTVCGDDIGADGWPYSASRPETVATGAAGDVFLCHPFLIHAAQKIRGDRPRFMSQPGLELTTQFDLSDPCCPVEEAIAAAL